MTPEAYILEIVKAGILAFAVYTGIRVDLARLHEKVTLALSSVDKAHTRIDHLLENKK